jgi:K+-transporting ATPase KdpF subunit
MKGRKVSSGQLPISNYQLPIIEWHRQRIPLAIFTFLCFTLLLAPVVYAAADGTLERRYAYAIALLGLVTLGLVVYLFVVVFQPERF